MKSWVIQLLCLFLLDNARAQNSAPSAPPPFTPILPGESSLVLDYQVDPLVTVRDGTAAKWMNFCKLLGKSLRIRKSQVGFAKESLCLELGKTPEFGSLGTEFQWRVQIYEKRHVFDINLMFRHQDQWLKVHSLNLMRSSDPMNQLKLGEVPLLLARLFIDRLPMGWAYQAKDQRDEVVFIKRTDGVRLPEKLYVYHLSFDSIKGIWLPQIYGVLKRQGEPRAVKKKIQGEVYTWQRIYIPLDRSKTYWVQNAEGVGKQEAALLKVLQDKNPVLKFLDFVEALTLNSLDSNYFGIRFGKSLQRDSQLLASLQQMSAVVEVRSGLLEGLRGYVDYIPRTEVTEDGLRQDMFLQRFSLGWSFRQDVPALFSSLASEWNVQPKIGTLDFDGNFELEGQFQNSFLNFKIERYLDLALELGLEKELDWFRYRLWASGNTSAVGKAQKAEGYVQSLRLGLDTYWELYSFSPKSHLNFVLYGYVEKMDLGKNPSKIPTDAPAVSQLTLQLPFVGGGLTFEW